MIHGIFILFAFVIRRSLSFTTYAVLSAPALGLEYWLESIARPKYDAGGNLLKAGEDLDSPGLTEFFWDIIYWTWINIIAVVLIGNSAWWAYLAVPAYGLYSAFTTAQGVRGALGGLSGAGAEGESTSQSQSKRQQKMEARGGQKVRYR